MAKLQTLELQKTLEIIKSHIPHYMGRKRKEEKGLTQSHRVS